MEYPHYIPFDQNFSCLPLANQQFLMENHKFSSIFMDRKRYQTARGIQRVYRYIMVYPYILSPFFLLNSPFFQAKWVGNPVHPASQNTPLFRVVRFLDFLRIFSRFSFAYWSLGISGGAVDFGRIRCEGEKVMVFLWSFL